MAIAVIGGLITSTVLSLLVVPVVFTYMDDLEQWMGRTRRRLRRARSVDDRGAGPVAAGAGRRERQWRLRAWLAICGVLGGGSLAVAWASGMASPVHALTAHPLAWDADTGWCRPWTLWTSAWVHTSGGSLAGNLLALAGLAVLGAALGGGAGGGGRARRWLGPWPRWLCCCGREVTSYAGLGGPIHAAAAVLGVHVLLHRPALKPLSFAAVRRHGR